MEIESESSESDGDWRGGNDIARKRSKRRARRQGQPKKRRRTANSDDDDVSRAGRVNSRTGRTVNYAELNDLDSDLLDSDDAAYVLASKDAVEDENVERIEYVCDFRATDTGNTDDKKGHALVDFDDSTVELNIKWISKSYRRNTWHYLDDLREYKGFKKVLNYVKYAVDRRNHLNDPNTPPEELEESHITIEEHRQNKASYEIIERVIAERPLADEPSQSEYLVKWTNLPYAECTWEPATDLNSDADLKALDEFSEREQAAASVTASKLYNPFNVTAERPRFRRMPEQPRFLHGEGRKLREYQLTGLNWMAFSWTRRNNVILADEMGLGKTLQTISFLGWLMYERSIPGPFLVVVPLSTSAAWMREFARWLPDTNVVRYCGNARSRSTIRDYEFWSTHGKRNNPKFHVLLTTPELVMLDEKYIDEIRWAAIAVDEAHRLKNETGALHQTLAHFRSANRLLVTGTPLQNSVRELWALLHFLNPDKFANADEFEENFSFSALRDPENVSHLHNTLRPYIIRRQKTDVEKSLPKKTYAVLRVGMSSSQQRYYKLLLSKNFAKLNEMGKGKGMGNTITLRNLVMELKKCCNHPFLFPSFFSTATDNNLKSYIRGSGKMILLDKLLLRLREKGHRVLIFSQMVSMLDILQEYCRMRGFPHQRLDGSMPNDLRQRAIDHFNAPESTDYVFLLSTRAGGLGINLATADTVIIFDSDWNPQNDLQAESRAHRIGQTKDVKVFRLLTRESVEEDILERAKRKRVLEHLVIHGVEGDERENGKDGAGKIAFKKEELSAILRFGAEKLFQASGDSAKQENDSSAHEPAADDEKAEERMVLAVDDIDELLARVPVDDSDEVGAAEPSVGDSLLNAFKWADFKTVEEDDEEETDIIPNGSNNQTLLAKTAAKGVAAIEDRRERDLVKAQQQEALEREMLDKEGDNDFWKRVIPEDLKDESDGIILGTRRRKKITYANEEPNDRKRRRITRAKASRSDTALTDKEQRALLKSLKRFGDPKRITDILQDAGLDNRVEKGEAMDMLQQALRLARKTVEEGVEGSGLTNGNNANGRSGKDRKGKGPTILIDLLGETNVDACDLVKRCNDLQSLRKVISRFDKDTRFRLQRPIKAPSYGVRWRPQQDALLLIGVNRHGFGNWARIADDPELHLRDKIFIPGKESSKKSGAPDSTKLSRRVHTLLRELERDTEPPPSKSKTRDRGKSKEKGSSKKKSIEKKPLDRKRRRTVEKESFDKEDNASKKSKETKKRKTASGKKSSKQKGLMIGALSATHGSTLEELKLLSTENPQMDKKERVSRTKQCLLKLGRTIDKQAGDSNRIRIELWDYVHHKCHTSLDGERLSGIYDKLANATGDPPASA